MADEDFPKTSETVTASAKGDTAPNALSVASVTESPVSGKADDKRNDHESRIKELEDEIRYLRKKFGWPEKE